MMVVVLWINLEGFGCDTSLHDLGFGRLELEVNSDWGPRELKLLMYGFFFIFFIF